MADLIGGVLGFIILILILIFTGIWAFRKPTEEELKNEKITVRCKNLIEGNINKLVSYSNLVSGANMGTNYDLTLLHSGFYVNLHYNFQIGVRYTKDWFFEFEDIDSIYIREELIDSFLKDLKYNFIVVELKDGTSHTYLCYNEALKTADRFVKEVANKLIGDKLH